jgi:TolB protein
MDATLVEDPLRVQNRVLSGVTVILLVALLGVVIWATSPRGATTAVMPPRDDNFAGSALLAATPQDTPVPVLLATTVPTVTPLPSILEARGTLAYTVRENAQEDIWLVGIGDRTPLRLITSPEDDRDPAWSPDGRRLAYASRQDGNWELYIYELATDSTTRMTFDLAFQGGPQWSPDGEWLVYESYQGNNLDIYVMRVDGSQVERLTDNAAPDFAPMWSPDGRRIAFTSWRDGNQDIYVFSLDDPRDAAVTNITNTPLRNEDYPAWSPDGSLLAFSAVDQGFEKVFVQPVDEPGAQAQVLGRGRAPTWSPDGASLIVSVDSFDGTQMVAIPFAGTGVATLVIPVALGASDPDWTAGVVPQSIMTRDNLPPGVAGPLFVEQVERFDEDPPYRLGALVDVDAESPFLNDRVNDSFNALRETVLEQAGWDFLGQLEDTLWDINRLPQPGEERLSWHKTGRAFAFNRNATVGFPPMIEVVREDLDINTYWRVFVRVADEAQNGQLGEPLRRMPWDFLSRNQGDVEAYNQGGRPRAEVPSGYYIDLTQYAADFDWSRVAAGTDWRGNFNSTNYWQYQKRDGLDWYEAMRELYTEGQLVNFTTSPATVAPLPQEPTPLPLQRESTPTTAAPESTLPPPPDTASGEGG